MKLITTYGILFCMILTYTGCTHKTHADIAGSGTLKWSVPSVGSAILSTFTGKSVDNIDSVQSIGEATIITASELSRYANINQNIIVTSAVNINSLRETSNFGRLYSESMIANFIKLGWNVIDFRGKKLFTTTRKGELYLDRTELKDVPANSVVYVATYSEYQSGLLINSRILDMKTNNILTASNVQLDDSSALAMSKRDNCTDTSCESGYKSEEEKFRIMIMKDDCTDSKRCPKTKEI